MLRDGSNDNGGTWRGVARGDHEQKCERVHRTLKRIVKARGALDAQECAALREAQKLMLWRAYGCASFVEYLEREMGYTQRAAIERLRVAKAIEEVPELGEAMNQGDLSFSGARELARVVTPETQNEWIAAAQDKCVRQIEEMVSGHKPGDRPTDAPDPGLKTKILRHEVKLSVAELERRARKALQRLRGSSVDDSEFMEACFKALLDQCEGATTKRSSTNGTSNGTSMNGASTNGTSTNGTSTNGTSTKGTATNGTSTNAERALAIVSPWSVDANGRGPSEAEIELLLMPRYQNANTICTECKRGWQHGVGTTLLTPAEVERALCDCEDIGCIDDAEPNRSKRSIPKPLKRHVLHRDGYRCRVPGCSATANIDVHHIMFFMNGGNNTLTNLITLCEGHHLALHEGSLVIEGDATNARFTRVPQNKFKIESRVVECTAELRKRGVAKELIKPAVAATRAHVGGQDLTARQWIDIALTKLPKKHPSR
jgi:predicted GNAT family acetyltransferase